MSAVPDPWQQPERRLISINVRMKLGLMAKAHAPCENRRPLLYVSAFHRISLDFYSFCVSNFDLCFDVIELHLLIALICLFLLSAAPVGWCEMKYD